SISHQIHRMGYGILGISNSDGKVNRGCIMYKSHICVVTGTGCNEPGRFA
ncbi:hypothetical protein TNCT_356771, partial [Trichonephila clavata]